MGLHGPLRELTGFVEEIERNAGEVTAVEFPDRFRRDTELATEIELTLPLRSACEDRDTISLRAGDIESDGTLRLEFETTGTLVPSATDTVETTIQGTSIGPDGTMTVVLTVLVSDDAHTASDSSVHDDSGAIDSVPADSVRADLEPDPIDGDEVDARSRASDRDVPPFEDTELLAEVYDSCETFAEMTAALDMDVTAETVRRYMIEHGIHEATTYDTVGAESDVTPDEPADAGMNGGQTPVVLTDGIGLSEDIDVDTLIEAVRKSRTIYEVTQEIGAERADVVETLREYDLLDLVVGRLAEDGRNEVAREEIVDRLREATATR